MTYRSARVLTLSALGVLLLAGGVRLVDATGSSAAVPVDQEPTIITTITAVDNAPPLTREMRTDLGPDEQYLREQALAAQREAARG